MSSSAIYFKNISDEDFSATWDSVPYAVAAGKEALLQDYIAVHLAKKLAMREIGKRNPSETINPSVDEKGNFTNEVFKNEVAKYLSDASIEEATPEKLEIAILVEKKKRKTKKKVEVEFPDLQKK